MGKLNCCFSVKFKYLINEINIVKDINIYLEIEKAKIQREKARLVLEKSLAMYIIFMLVAVLGFIFGHIDHFMLNLLIIVGIVILIIGTLPYTLISHKEEKRIDSLLKK
jgi:L-asparagine transporter-like permease